MINTFNDYKYYLNFHRNRSRDNVKLKTELMNASQILLIFILSLVLDYKYLLKVMIVIFHFPPRD